MDEKLIRDILLVVENIPAGCVATYGQIASIIGRPENSRLVGKALSAADCFGNFPCHRVVNCVGRLAPRFVEQRRLLEIEGVPFRKNGNVDLKKCIWNNEQ